MLSKICLIFGLLIALAVPARAVDLRQAIAAPGETVDEYEPAENDLHAFYEAREFKLAWNLAGHDNNTAFIAFLDSIAQFIDYHGLRRDDYALDLMRKLAAASDDASAQNLELLTTETLLRLAHDLHGDYGELEDLYPGWNFHRGEVNIPALLAAAVAANSLNEFIEGLAPKNPAYTELAKALRTYRAIAASGGWNKIDPGPSLKPNDRGPRVAQLRARLMAENYLPNSSPPKGQNNFFDNDLSKALATYQTRNGFTADGHMGPKTLAALNAPVEARIDQIRANMERWRHMPDDFPPPRYAAVNIADASLVINDGGKIIYRGPVIIGRVDRKTPFIQSNIRSMIVNPAWHVPLKIAKKDILPKLRKDPHYLEKLGFVIRDNEEDPYGNNIDWESMPAREFDFRLRQSPGDKNSLGRLKFDFDNDFAVYLHGTPHQELFDKDQRTLSSGCVRLRDPEQVAQIFLTGTKGDWTTDKIKDEVEAGETRWVAIAKPMPLYILYWTVFTDESGALNFRKDVYDYDAELMALPTTGVVNP